MLYTVKTNVCYYFLYYCIFYLNVFLICSIVWLKRINVSLPRGSQKRDFKDFPKHVTLYGKSPRSVFLLCSFSLSLKGSALCYLNSESVYFMNNAMNRKEEQIILNDWVAQQLFTRQYLVILLSRCCTSWCIPKPCENIESRTLYISCSVQI